MGKQRPRLFFANGKNIVYTPQKTKNYEKQVREAYLEKTNVFFDEKVPVEIEILAYYEIPKTLEKSARIEVIERAIKPLKKPDIDNIAKIVCDGLNGTAFHDDKQIFRLKIEKRYAKIPKIQVRISNKGDKYGKFWKTSENF